MESRVNDEDQQSESTNLPKPAHGAWRIQAHYLPIAHRGHLFFTLVNPSGEPVRQLHGLAQSRHTEEIMSAGPDGSKLVAGEAWMPPEKTTKIKDLASGTYDEVVKGKWARGLRAAKEISQRDLDYKGDDLSYELLRGNGGQIQNSNSAAYTHSKAMDLDTDEALRDTGIERKFPGWARDLLDRNYEPYVAPSALAVTDAP